MARKSAADQVRMLVAPDLRKFIDSKPADGFVEWMEATAERMADAKTPYERVYARLMRAMLVAAVETSNAAVRDGADLATVAVLMPRAAMLCAACGLISVMSDDTPTSTVRDAIIRELDLTLEVMVPGKTLGDRS